MRTGARGAGSLVLRAAAAVTASTVLAAAIVLLAVVLSGHEPSRQSLAAVRVPALLATALLAAVLATTAFLLLGRLWRLRKAPPGGSADPDSAPDVARAVADLEETLAALRAGVDRLSAAAGKRGNGHGSGSRKISRGDVSRLARTSAELSRRLAALAGTNGTTRPSRSATGPKP